MLATKFVGEGWVSNKVGFEQLYEVQIRDIIVTYCMSALHFCLLSS